MTPTFTACCRASTVVPELELDAEVLAPEERDRLLQIIARRRGHAHLVTLDGGLNFLELRLLDRGGDFFGRVAVERHLEGDLLSNGVATRRLDLAGIHVL